MAVVGEPFVTPLKRSASFTVAKKAKKRINEFTSYSSSSTLVTGLNNDLSSIGYLSTYESKNFPDIVSSSLRNNDNNVSYRSKRSEATKAFKKTLCGKLHEEACAKLKAETPSSTDTYPSLPHRHFMDAIDGEAGSGRNHSDFEDDVCSSQMCRKDSSSQEWSPNDVPDTGDCDVVTCQGRVVFMKYANSLPVLFVPCAHSAMKFQYVKPMDASEAVKASVVRPLRKAYDQLFDILQETFHSNDHDMFCYLAMANRWTGIRTEPTRHLTKSLMKKMRHSTQFRSSLACYRVLMRALQAFPLTDRVPFSLSDLEKAVDNLSGFLEFDCRCNNKLSLVNLVLWLTFMVSCLENELLNCKQGSKRRVSLSCVCSWLSAEKRFTFVKRIIQVLVDFLRNRELLINDLVLVKEAESGDDCHSKRAMQMVSELLPILQRLIVLSQAVSSYPAQTADRIATELSAEYSQITLLSHRREYLESLSVPLIKLKLCQRILERQYPSAGRARVCGSLTSLTLDSLLSNYMRRGETTDRRSEPGCWWDSDWVPCCVDGRLLPLERDMCEEFSVLLFTIVLSYVQVKKEGKQNETFSV